MRIAILGLLSVWLTLDSSQASDWSTHGAGDFEQRYSTLTNIQRKTIASLGLAWEQSAHSHRGLEATPIVVDGIMYTTSTWSRVMALNAVTGQVLWTYDPDVPKFWAKRLCCDVVNRGVAVNFPDPGFFARFWSVFGPVLTTNFICRKIRN